MRAATQHHRTASDSQTVRASSALCRAAMDSSCFGSVCLINLNDADSWARFNFANLRNDQANLVRI